MLVVMQWSLVAAWAAGVLFAIAYGRRCERLGAAICVAGAVLSASSQVISLRLLGDYYPTAVMAFTGLAECIAWALLTVRYSNKLWPGVAGCFQFMVMIFSISQQTNFPLPDQVMVAMINLSALGVTASLTAGTYMTRWRKPPVDQWEQYAETLASLPPPRHAS